MNKKFILYYGCNYLYIQGLNFKNISKRIPGRQLRNTYDDVGSAGAPGEVLTLRTFCRMEIGMKKIKRTQRRPHRGLHLPHVSVYLHSTKIISIR